MFAHGAPLDYISHPPYIATLEQRNGTLKTEGFDVFVEAILFFFAEWNDAQAVDSRAMLIDARGAGVVTYRPGGGLQGWSITTEAVRVGQMIWPDMADVFTNLELLAIERAVLLGVPE